MAIRVALPQYLAEHPLTVAVFALLDDGDGDDATANAGTTALAELMTAHRYTDDVDVLPAGTPTNQIGERAATWNTALPDPRPALPSTLVRGGRSMATAAPPTRSVLRSELAPRRSHVATVRAGRRVGPAKRIRRGRATRVRP